MCLTRMGMRQPRATVYSLGGAAHTLVAGGVFWLIRVQRKMDVAASHHSQNHPKQAGGLLDRASIRELRTAMYTLGGAVHTLMAGNCCLLQHS